MNLVDLIIVSTLSVLFVILSALMIASNLKHRKTLSLVAQMLIDRSAMSEEIERLTFIVENTSDLHDGFIKFLSESREEAFSYITEVQEAIDSLKMAMELGEETMINEAYIKLISFLPNENPDVVD